jgi:hypothetical protein
MHVRAFIVWTVAGVAGAPLSAQPVAQRLSVRVESGEARAVLSILDKRAAGQALTDADWRAVWQSEGYTRLARREQSMGRTFTDSAFREFVLSADLLARRTDLARTLRDWEGANPSAAAARALSYLPPNAHIRATIYPVIKPQENSFVFEVTTNPAIFLYVDPAQSSAMFENVLAHELHHIGYRTACRDSVVTDSARALADQWLGAFGEGLAMLAAAGNATTHPHALSSREDRARWDRDLANAPADMPMLEVFFTDILERRLTGNAVTQEGMKFFGVQGPWYTVGWMMGSSIERAFGRPRLIGVLCDPVALLTTYEEAAIALNRAGERLPRWSPAFLSALTRG